MLQFMAAFIAYPWAALVVAAVFAILHVRRRRGALALAGGAWLLYGLYEYLIQYRILCDGDCNIRVDLLLIYPVLIVLSLGAIISLFLRR
jgi:hypothetical protein